VASREVVDHITFAAAHSFCSQVSSRSSDLTLHHTTPQASDNTHDHMTKDDYASIGGSLKLKGVQGSKIDKKKKKKKKATATAKEEIEVVESTAEQPSENPLRESESKERSEIDGPINDHSESEEAVDLSLVGKTAAERRHEERRKRRVRSTS
jgi:protein FAM32A